MAERLNAHDSKSCYAGMYTRVQIPFSAPKPTKGSLSWVFTKKGYANDKNKETDLLIFHSLFYPFALGAYL